MSATVSPSTHRRVKGGSLWTPEAGHQVPDGTPMPKAVAQAAATVKKALDARAEVMRELEDARRRERGPAPEAARADIQEAARRYREADDVLRDALLEQAVAIADTHAQWRDERAQAVTDRIEGIQRRADELNEEFSQLTDERAILRAIEQFNPADPNPMHFFVELRSEHQRARERQRHERTTQAFAARERELQINGRDPSQLTAAVSILAARLAREA